jgi:hypothetical protein
LAALDKELADVNARKERLRELVVEFSGDGYSGDKEKENW